MSSPITKPRTGNVIRSARVASRRNELHDRLLKTSAELFAKRGLSAVSVEELLDAVGISRATFYGFFANKSELAAAILTPVFDSGLEALSEEPPADARAKARMLVNMYLTLWDAHREALLLTSMVDATVFPYIRQQHDQFGHAIRDVLAAVNDAGLLRNGDVDLSYRVLATTGIPLLKLYKSHPDFRNVYRDSMLALLLN